MTKWKNLLAFPLVLGFLGFIFSSRPWILFLDSHSPPVGLGFYYMILFVAILFLQHIGLIVAKMPFDSISHAIGTLLIIFSFFIVFDWESLYINQVTNQPTQYRCQQCIFAIGRWSSVLCMVQYDEFIYRTGSTHDLCCNSHYFIDLGDGARTREDSPVVTPVINIILFSFNSTPLHKST